MAGLKLLNVCYFQLSLNRIFRIKLIVQIFAFCPISLNGLLAVYFEVNSLRLVEEQVFEFIYDFLLCHVFQSLNLFQFVVKLEFLIYNLLQIILCVLEKTSFLLLQLIDQGKSSTVKLSWSPLISLIEPIIYPMLEVVGIFVTRLNQKIKAVYFTYVKYSRLNDVTKLFLCSKLVENLLFQQKTK